MMRTLSVTNHCPTQAAYYANYCKNCCASDGFESKSSKISRIVNNCLIGVVVVSTISLISTTIPVLTSHEEKNESLKIAFYSSFALIIVSLSSLILKNFPPKCPNRINKFVHRLRIKSSNLEIQGDA